MTTMKSFQIRGYIYIYDKSASDFFYTRNPMLMRSSEPITNFGREYKQKEFNVYSR